MNFHYDAVFAKKSFDEIDNIDMKTILVEKIEFLTKLCYRMHEKIVIMEIKMERNQEELVKWKEQRIKDDFCDATMACDDNRIGTHKVVIANQDDLLK